MKHILLLCLVLTCVLPCSAQVILFQSAGGGGVTPSQADNGILTHVGAVGNALIQASGTNNSRAGFFWAYIDWRPAAPSITLDVQSSSNFYVNWNAIPDATGYKLDVSKNNTFSSFVEEYNGRNIPTTPPLQFNVTGLESSTQYYVRMRAVNANGESPNSVWKPATTLSQGGSVLTIGAVAQAPQSNGTQLSVTLSGGDGARTVKFYSRGIRGNAFSQTIVNSASDAYQVTVPHTDLDELGLEFYFTAEDATVGTPKRSPEINNAYTYKPIPTNTTLNLPFGGTVGDYRIISLPYIVAGANANAVSNIFATLLPFDKTLWRLVNWNGNSYNDFTGTMATGQGYWFNARAQHTITLGEGTVSQNNQSKPFELSLRQGWNMVSTPWPFTISWDDVLEYNGNPAVGDYHVFNGTGYTTSDNLEPWKGGFVQSDNAITLQIPVVFGTPGGRKGLREQFTSLPGEGNWLLPLTIKQGGFENTLTAFGMHSEASESKDRFDAVALPRFMEYVDLTTTREDSFIPYLMRDVVPLQEQYVWPFTLDASGNEPVTIQWNNEAIQNSKSQLLLYDAAAGKLTDMRTTATYTTPNGSNRQLQFIFNTGERYAGNRELGKAYPNPFIKEINLPGYLHTAEGQATVTVSIIGLTGVEVHNEKIVTSTTGLLQPVWDGTNSNGFNLPPGVYVYKVVFNSGKQSYVSMGKIVKQ